MLSNSHLYLVRYTHCLIPKVKTDLMCQVQDLAQWISHACNILCNLVQTAHHSIYQLAIPITAAKDSVKFRIVEENLGLEEMDWNDRYEKQWNIDVEKPQQVGCASFRCISISFNPPNTTKSCSIITGEILTQLLSQLERNVHSVTNNLSLSLPTTKPSESSQDHIPFNINDLNNA